MEPEYSEGERQVSIPLGGASGPMQSPHIHPSHHNYWREGTQHKSKGWKHFWPVKLRINCVFKQSERLSGRLQCVVWAVSCSGSTVGTLLELTGGVILKKRILCFLSKTSRFKRVVQLSSRKTSLCYRKTSMAERWRQTHWRTSEFVKALVKQSPKNVNVKKEGAYYINTGGVSLWGFVCVL